MTAKRIAPLSLIVGPLTALLIVVGSNLGAADPPKRALIGSWLETVTFPPEIRPPIKALSTFHEDGTITISDQGSVTTAGPMPGVFTAGHGVWKHLGRRTFAYTSLELISDLSGNLVGYLKVRGTLIVSESGNEWADGSHKLCRDIRHSGQRAVLGLGEQRGPTDPARTASPCAVMARRAVGAFPYERAHTRSKRLLRGR